MERHILWVDDEIELLKSHVMFLKDKGYDVETTTNGEDAISLVRERKFDIMLAALAVQNTAYPECIRFCWT